ncbi:MAG: glycosyltransferase family 4 protein [Pseudomonadota bacterium]
MTRPSVLFVTQQCPWPKNSGGNIRTYFIARHLARLAAVTLVTTRPESGAAEAQAALEEFCTAVHMVDDVKTSGLARVGALARSVAHGRPAFIEHNLNPNLETCIAALRQDTPFAWFHLNQVDTYHYFRGEQTTPLVLDTHNLHWAYYERRAERESNPAMSALYGRDGRLLRDYELQAFRHASRVLVCSDDERRSIDAIATGLPVTVIPNGVDCDEHRPSSHDAFDNPPELIFVGDMGYAPNHDGVMEFIAEVMPTVRDRVPGAHLTVVGRAPAEDLLAAAAGRDDVEVTGFVDSVAPYVDKAKIFVVPLRYGAGTRLKVPQAFASGLPTVSTRIGAEGIDYTDGEDIVIADDNAMIAERICELLEDRERFDAMRAACRATAMAHYDWGVIGDALIEACQPLADGR